MFVCSILELHKLLAATLQILTKSKYILVQLVSDISITNTCQSSGLFRLLKSKAWLFEFVKWSLNKTIRDKPYTLRS